MRRVSVPDQRFNTSFPQTPVKTSVRIKAVVGAFLFVTHAALAGAETLVIPGSGAPEYIVGVLAKAFNGRQALHTIVVPTTTGTAGALRDVGEGTASIGRVGRSLTDAELRNGLTYHPFARDPVTFVGGSEVAVRRLSRQQAIDIYSGNVTNWRELGGTSRLIRAIGREPSDSSILAIGRYIEGFDRMPFAASVKVVHLDTQMIELLDRYPTSLGFLNRSALRAAKTRLVPLVLDSLESTAETLASGTYPMWTELGLVYRKDRLTDAGRAFLQFVDSPDGAALLRSYGLTPAMDFR
jgi:phosphate transport system substrate-binding protein